MNFFLEYFPIVIFFLLYKVYGIMPATCGMMCCSVFALVAAYILSKPISKMNIFATFMIVVSSLLTISTGSTDYIKMKPTLVYTVFALLLLFSLSTNRLWLKLIFSSNVISISDHAWKILSKRCILYFSVMAIINEIVWRNFSEDIWVSYKIFGSMMITFIFLLSQIRFIVKSTNNSRNTLYR